MAARGVDRGTFLPPETTPLPPPIPADRATPCRHPLHPGLGTRPRSVRREPLGKGIVPPRHLGPAEDLNSRAGRRAEIARIPHPP